MSKYVIFIPGYLTTQGCSHPGDTYRDVARGFQRRGFEFLYLPLPNSNDGDRGNSTLEDHLEHVIQRYNQLCEEYRIGSEDFLVLAGHSMGGLLTAKLLTSTYLDQLLRPPNCVRLLNPVFRTRLSFPRRLLSTLCSFLPDFVLRTLAVPLPIATREILFPGSLAQSPVAKPLLGGSVLRATNGLLCNNRPWGLRPEDTMRNVTRVVTCRGDRLASFEASEAYAEQFEIELVALPLNDHESFGETVLAALIPETSAFPAYTTTARIPCR